MPEPKVSILDLTSGFTIKVKPLPPYYNDFIEDALPLKPLPTRKLTLLAGDPVEVEYIKPDTFPPDPAEQELYLLYTLATDENKKLEAKRQKSKRDYLIVNCIEIVDGPYKVTDQEWVTTLESSLPGYKVPAELGMRFVVFVKTQVITTQVELDEIFTASMYPEVNIQGILAALSHFPDRIQGSGLVGVNTAKAG
jgi:hypothetical protein